MNIKKRAGRPKKKIEEKKVMPTENIEPKVEAKKQNEFVDMFPDREPIYGEELYDDPDPTKLTKNGKDWNPREHGYETRLMDQDMIDKMGWRGYVPVPKASGIRFKTHPLTDSGIGTKNFGDVVSTISRDNRVVREKMLGKDMADYFERQSKYVEMNKMVLCLAPIEKPTARRKLASEISNSSLRKDFQQADAEAQSDLGNSKTHGKFTLGGNASRSNVDGKTKSIRKIWSVPAQIK